MRIIVALDILEGKCVRLTRGDYATKKIYNEDPLEVARKIEDHGIKYIHVVDLDGAKAKHVVNHRILEKISARTTLNIDFGGGIRTDEDLRIAFNSGSKQVTCGSIAASEPLIFQEWLMKWGPERIILGADCKNRKIATEGWIGSIDTDIVKFIAGYQLKGVKYTICTDIEKDGMMEGPAIDLYREILEMKGLNLIASGGVSSVKDIELLADAGCEGAIIGKALYEGVLNLTELGRLC